MVSYFGMTRRRTRTTMKKRRSHPENRSDDINATEKSIMMKKEIKKLIFLSAMMLGWHRVVWGAYTCTYNPYTVYNVLYLYAFNSIHTYTLYIYICLLYTAHILLKHRRLWSQHFGHYLLGGEVESFSIYAALKLNILASRYSLSGLIERLVICGKSSESRLALFEE